MVRSALAALTVCGCPRDRLCDSCLDQSWLRLRGGAARRADTWLEQLPPSVRAKPWPGCTDRVMEIALRKVSDLGSDPRLLSMLAAELAAWAAKRWG